MYSTPFSFSPTHFGLGGWGGGVGFLSGIFLSLSQGGLFPSKVCLLGIMVGVLFCLKAQ